MRVRVCARACVCARVCVQKLLISGFMGMVQVSGTVAPVLLLKVMRKSRKEVQIAGWKFGGCSRNLHMPEYQPCHLAA